MLQEAVAAKVGAITTFALEEQHEARNRDQLAAAELRARMTERRALEALPALGPAVDLVRELRRLVDHLLGSGAVTCAPTEDRITPTHPTGGSSERIAIRPPAPELDSNARKEGAS